MIRTKHKLNSNKYSIVSVVWEDITTLSGWQSEEDILNDNDKYLCTTVGFLFEKTKDHLKIISTHSRNSKILSLTTIPLGAILSIEKYGKISELNKSKRKRKSV